MVEEAIISPVGEAIIWGENINRPSRVARLSLDFEFLFFMILARQYCEASDLLSNVLGPFILQSPIVVPAGMTATMTFWYSMVG